MIALAALIVLAKTPSVTLTVRARPLKEACDLLGRQAGLQLDVKGCLRAEPIILAVTQLSSPELLEKIAQVVNASWTKVGEGHYELARTNAQEKREYQDHIRLQMANNARLLAAAAKASSLDKSLTAQDFVAVLKARLSAIAATKTRPSDPVAFERRTNSDAELPAHRALIRLLLDMKQEELAGVEPQSSRVFSSEPTRMQFALGPKSQSIIRLLHAERQLMLSAAEKVPGGLTGISGFADSSDTAQLPWDGRGTVAVKVGYSGFGGGLVANLFVYDSKNDLLLRDSFGLPAAFKFESVELPKNPTVELSPDSKQVLTALRAAAVYRNQRAVSKAPEQSVVPLLTDWNRYDPLSFCAADVFIATAKTHGVNLIAVPDDEMAMAFLSFPENPTAKTFLQLISRQTQFALDSRWLTVTPKDRYATRMGRLDRDAGKDYLMARAALGYTSLEENLKLALAIPYLPQPSLLYYHELALGPSIRGFDGSRKALRFYASLSEGQRNSILNGGQLSYAALDSVQRQFLEDWVFRSEYEGMGVTSDRVATRFAAKSSEPTFAVGEGLLRPFAVSASATSIPVAVCYSEHGTFAMDADTLALNMARHYYVEEGDMQYPEPLGYRPGKNMEISLRVTFEPGLQMRSRINGLDVDMAGEPVPMDGLPQSFRTEYEKQLTKYIAALKNAGAKSTGATEPPPP